MNKCHSPIGWHNDTTPALNETNLNYMDGCIDTIDDRVVAMDSSKLESEDVEDVIVNVTMDDDTGIFTFTKYDGTTFTIDTKLEKIAVNFRYDTATQKLIITLDDGTTQEIDLSSLIQETDFADSSTIVWTVANHVASASIKGNSIGDAQMQTGYLTDCQSAKSSAETAVSNANASKLQSEGFAVGEQNGVPVGSTSPYYHNNAKYYAQQAGGTSLVGLSDVSITSPTNGQALVYDADEDKWVNGDSLNIMTKTNVIVYSHEWVADATYSDFGYRADITFSEIDSSWFSDVVFDVTEAISGYFAPISVTGTNKVSIYCKALPADSITIPTIKVVKGVSA